MTAAPLTNLSDESLMERLKEQDHRAFSILVERHSHKFYAASYRMVQSQQDAEDITQEAFLKIWDRPQLWKGDKGAKFTTWFYRIVMNMSLDFIRKGGKARVMDIDDILIAGTENQEKELVQKQEQKLLSQALHSLPEKQLMALNLCVYEGASNREAAEIMDVGVKALESLLMRGRENLKSYIAQNDVPERKQEMKIGKDKKYVH